MEKKEREELDNIIKDYYGKIRKRRDIMYRAGQLPILMLSLRPQHTNPNYGKGEGNKQET